jgi:hypothetical protein
MEVMYNPTGADDGREWVEIYNPDAVDIDLSDYALGWGGDDYTLGTLALSGVIAPGEVWVVGGPTSDAGNGNPVFDQVADMGPDLENPGFIFAPAAGIAIFDVTGGPITVASVPVDAFIYGGTLFSTNSRGLIDETGAPGAVEFTSPFFGAGQSAEFDGTGWVAAATPTPGSTPEPGTGLLLGLGLMGLARLRR